MKIKEIIQKAKNKECEHEIRIFMGMWEDGSGWGRFKCQDCGRQVSTLASNLEGLRVGYPVVWINRGRF